MNETDQTKLGSLMDEYVQLNADIRELKQQKEELKSKMLIEIKTQDIDRHEENGNLLTFRRMTRKTIDKDALGRFLVDHDKDLEDFKTESEFETLRCVKKEE